MRKLILMLSGAALALSSLATPASAQSGGWPVDQDATDYVAEQGGSDQFADEDAYDKDQPIEMVPVDPDGAYLQDGPVAQGPYRPGDTYRGDGQPLEGNHCRRSDGTTGAIVGGAGGALIGRGIDTRGRRGTGTILGAIAGALIGSAIERGQNCR